MTEIRLHNVGITGMGMSFPDKVLSNADLEKMVDTNDQWIVERTGIRERRIVEKGVGASVHGAESARRAIAQAGLTPEDIDLIVVPTVTPDMMFPSTACIIQDMIGATNAWGYDLGAACSGYLFALESARCQVASGMVKNAIVIGTEIMSSIVDYEDRNTCILFGDGAGAAVIQPVADSAPGIIDSINYIDGSGVKHLHMKAGGSQMPASSETVANKLHYIYQEGGEVYKRAVRGMADVALQVVEKNGFKKSDVKLLVPHQANTRIIAAAQRRLNLTDEQVVITIDRYGNTTSASIPTALQIAYEEGRVEKGDLVVLVSFGAGFTWGATLLRWGL